MLIHLLSEVPRLSRPEKARILASGLWRLVALMGLATVFLLWGVLFSACWGEMGQTYPGFRVNRVGTVWMTNESYLPGIQAGLRPGDRILAADGLPLTRGVEVKAYARSLAHATLVKYRCQREGRTIDVSVQTQPFGISDFVRAFLVRLGLPLGMALLGFAALWLRPVNPAAQSNFIFCVGWAIYGLLDIDFEWTYLFHPLWYYASVMLYASGALAMALTFPSIAGPFESRVAGRMLPYLLSGILFAPILWVFFDVGIAPRAVEWGEVISAAWANFVLLVGLVVFLIRSRWTADVRQKAQLQVLLLGIAIAYLPYALLANVPLFVFGFPPSPVILSATSLLFVVFPLSASYAIVRHGMFDIDIIVKRTTTYAVLTSFLLGGYFAAAGMVRWVASALGLQGTAWESALVTAMIAVSFVPLRDAVSRAVNRLFSRVPYDFRSIVARVTEAAQSSIDVHTLQKDFLALIDEALGPRFVYILTREPGADSLIAAGPHAVWGEAPLPELRIRGDDELLLRFGGAVENEYEPGSGSTGSLSALAAIGRHYRIPLLLSEEVVGLLILGPRRSDKEYSLDDRALLAATRLPLAAAIKTASLVEARLFKDRIEQDLRRAREVQEAMLPRVLPAVDGFQFAASSIPCHEASGDYFDCVSLSGNRIALAVADVAGKGFAAALATAMLKSCLYNQIESNPAVVDTLEALNRLLFSVTRHAQVKSYTTCLYALLEEKGGILEYACAGHFPPLHWRADREAVVEYEPLPGFPLGVRAATHYRAQRINLALGDVLIFYTDGVTEARRGPYEKLIEPDIYETERLSAVLKRSAHLDAAGILTAIEEDLRGFVGDRGPRDDVTLLVLKRLAAS